ncbi:hypothetical protein HYT84_02655 [Candidatus Micrarchaeota archaeon]|nr:hypothetical protein [Candidatus Micrarchaeota archaeon]
MSNLNCPIRLVEAIPGEAKDKLRLAVELLRVARERIPVEKIIGGALFFGIDEYAETVMIPTRKAATCYRRAIRIMQELADQYPDHPRVLRAINRILQKGCLEMENFAEEDPEFRLNGSGFTLLGDVGNKMIGLLEGHLAAL